MYVRGGVEPPPPPQIYANALHLWLAWCVQIVNFSTGMKLWNGMALEIELLSIVAHL